MSFSNENQSSINYAAYVEATNAQMCSAKAVTTVANLGGIENYAKLLNVIEAYNNHEGDIILAAIEIKAASDTNKFNYHECENNGVIFWNFLKTSKHFRDAAWYLRDYVSAKIMGQSVKIDQIL